MAREAERRFGLPIAMVLLNASEAVVEAVKGRHVDLAFFTIDPKRAVDADHMVPDVVIEGVFMVPKDLMGMHGCACCLASAPPPEAPEKLTGEIVFSPPMTIENNGLFVRLT